MKLNMKKVGFFVATCVILSACGGSSDSINNEEINASLAEDSQWQSNFSFTDTPVVLSNATNGNVAVSAAGVTYSPNANFNGTDSITVEAGNTRYAISLTITPENDLPELSNPQLNVTASDEISGQLQAADIDNDIVSFSLDSEPQNGSVTIQTDGAFVYTPSEFGLPVDSFTVTLDDGTGTTQASVDLVPAYSSNADKAAYYYRSDSSHIKEASDILSTINDDIATEDAYISLAIGYANAGLDTQLTQLLDDNLSTQQAKATVFRRLGNFEQARNNQGKAAEYYQQSLQTYSQFIADNGLDNISSSDASFLQSLFANARELDNTTLTDNIEQQLNLYLSKLGGADVEYTTAFGRFITAYRFEIQDAIAKFQQDQTDMSKTLAIAAAQRFTDIVQQTGYQTVRRGENEGERYYRLAPLYNAEAVGYFFSLGETEMAKEQLAFTLAYYTEVIYDENLNREALQYANITQAEYSFPLIDAAYYLSVLYPDMQNNLVTSLVPDGDIFEDDVANAILDATALNTALNGGMIDDAIAQVELLYSNRLRDVVERLTSRTIGSDPYFGETLLNLGNTEGAIAAYDRALEILQSDAYLEDNTSTTSRATGFRGCLKIVEFFSRIENTEKLSSSALACEDIQTRYFSNNNDDELDVAEAHIDVIDAFTLSSNPQKVNETLASLESFLINSSRSDVFERRAQVGVIYMANQNVSAALTQFTTLATALGDASFDTAEDKVEAYIEVLEALGQLSYEDDSFFDRQSAAVVHKSYYDDQSFASQTSQLKTLVSDLSDQVIADIAELPVAEVADIYEDVIEVLSDNRQYEKVKMLITTLEFAGEEQILSLALLASSVALQDDFPFTNVASIDTDGDGLANFFAPSASQESVDSSGIQADEDADNDGIADSDDLLPLSPNND